MNILLRYLLLLALAFMVSACAASWDVGKGNVDIVKRSAI